MNNSNGSAAAGGGIGFLGVLAIAFIVLKLLGVIKWSWLWVLSPIWLPVIVALVGVAIFIWIVKR